MKKFKVYLTRKDVFTKLVIVEADNLGDAEEKAKDEAVPQGWNREPDEDELEVEGERINPPYDTVDFPAYALSALINDDWSGMSTDDVKYLRNWVLETETRIRHFKGADCEIVYDPGEATYFSTAQVFGLPSDCVELEVHVFPKNKTFEENLK